jgi:histidyl-tRNA synthetase|tara:strand:+ start:266 stop:1441 length:1176 start_codon:yes stop_codon:yes gene_type:complete
VASVARNIALRYGLAEISTPVFEFSEVFKRTLGETSDVVTKEMYTFEDRGGSEITLRPEGTAGIVRAFISNGLTQNLPCKFFYEGPMFRYERPQKGRLRQFHQFGVEILGVPTPQADVETIALGVHILEELGVADKTVLEINSLGDSESRAAYREALVAYFTGHRDALSEDSRARLERNPLRILDSKDKGDRKLMAEAPNISEYLNDASRAFFDTVLDGLKTLNIDVSVNPRLVRGLDYYCHTAFEFTTEVLGAQGAVIAGGRYDGLVKQMGGPATPGVGWAAGIERLTMLLPQSPEPTRPIAVIPVGEEAQGPAMTIAQTLRENGYVVDMGYSGNLAKRMKRADRMNACAAVILGGDELERNSATLRDLDSGEQSEIPLDDLTDRLSAFR